MEWFMMALKRYAEFSGRSRRKEYWFFLLFYILIALALGVADAMLSLGLLSPLFALAMLIPSLAVTVRRLHDIGKSGWWLLLAIVPLANLVLIYFMFVDSEPGPNRFGPSPKFGVVEATA